MQEHEIQRLAAMGNALRPDWHTKSLHTFLSKHFAGRARRDVAVALAWVACTSTETPRLLLEAGPWWKAAATDSGHVQRPPRKGEECEIHAGNWRDSCHGCAADKLAGDRTTPGNPRRPDVSDHLAQARAELAATRAHLCPCGIRPQACTDHRPESAAEREEETHA